MKKCITITIGKTTITQKFDDDPVFDLLGEYTDDLKPGVIVRYYNEFYEKIKTEMERDYDGRFLGKLPPDVPDGGDEYRGFKPFASGEKHGSKDFYKYGMQDYNRMKSYNRGHWYFVGIIVQTNIIMDIGSDSVISSLWGIESDSGTENIREIIDDLLIEQKNQLLKMGFKIKEIEKSFKEAEEVDL